MATVIDAPTQPAAPATSSTAYPPSLTTHVLSTVHSFPTMEPLRFAYYPNNQLYLPLRKDLLHRAVIYEGDNERQGTASTKWRDEVHGSHRKLYRQKGTGRARVGDKQSPIRRGGGVAFGPKPRDFGTDLPRKIYDLAWRTALSYRYRRGELLLVEDMKNLESSQMWYLTDVFQKNGWGRENKRSMLVTMERMGRAGLFDGIGRIGQHGEIKEVRDVDVKNLLETGRIIIEKRALDFMLKRHSSDIMSDRPMISSKLPPIELAAAEAL